MDIITTVGTVAKHTAIRLTGKPTITPGLGIAAISGGTMRITVTIIAVESAA
jgi:hypothetical protein